jgi:hypothetical protein
LTRAYQVFKTILSLGSKGEGLDPSLTKEELDLSPALEQSLDMLSAGRRLCITDDGYFGWVPPGAALGDIVCLFSGGRVLYVIQKLDDGPFRLIGEAYIHSLMHGEVLERDTVDWQDIALK